MKILFLIISMLTSFCLNAQPNGNNQKQREKECVKFFDYAVYFWQKGNVHWKSYVKSAKAFDKKITSDKKFSKDDLDNTSRDYRVLRRDFIELVTDFDASIDNFYKVKRQCPEKLYNELSKLDKITNILGDFRKDLRESRKLLIFKIKEWSDKNQVDCDGSCLENSLDDEKLPDVPHFDILPY